MATTTPTVRIKTTFRVCAVCGAKRRSREAMELHFEMQHENVKLSFTTRSSIYGQPASFPVPEGDVIIEGEIAR